MIFSSRFDTKALRQSVVAGVIVALALLAGGVAYALTQHRTWAAESMVVVLPAANLDDATSASYYETLSRGQIVATFAEVAGSLGFEQQAEDRLGLTTGQRAQVTTDVSVVPDTAVILIRATADDPDVAQRMVAATTDLSVQYLAGLSKPYRVVTVPSAAGSASATGMSLPVLLAAGLAVALVAGLALQQAVYHLSVALRGQPKGEDSAARPDVETPVRRSVIKVL
jgi:capsular polysaccharide biosynthesis protein